MFCNCLECIERVTYEQVLWLVGKICELGSMSLYKKQSCGFPSDLRLPVYSPCVAFLIHNLGVAWRNYIPGAVICSLVL